MTFQTRQLKRFAVIPALPEVNCTRKPNEENEEGGELYKICNSNGCVRVQTFSAQIFT
jgi:hypothetical protein